MTDQDKQLLAMFAAHSIFASGMLIQDGWKANEAGSIPPSLIAKKTYDLATAMLAEHHKRTGEGK